MSGRWPTERKVTALAELSLPALGVCLLSVAMVLIAIDFVPHEFDGLRAAHFGLRGTIEVRRCTTSAGKWYDCRGSFVGDDGARIDDVSLTSLGHGRPPTTYRARVSSATASQAWDDSGWDGAAIIVAPGFYGIVGFVAYRLWRSRRRRRRRGRKDPLYTPRHQG
ncbi:hypothetical protein [Rugosimonospora africana]|uniref:Uncharacterized protein n=1 Tax=Rugosimonospora africana TaxID=556532 RepID=A0A8J3R2A3_9ACTN|nr:hypothetical protein [Rugosimonospora africana]GIH21660.1 hypothetical protein Raf01_98320 [Rugosimonospora africana]